ncbi:uncharacterized protein LOC130649272 isoform X2 [Hydractinia symbiolongicarpus]|uniref:uncharacterized protein LOC130649272 isoform X2 n=1 Tax=Hydractinia symbiolongicarpus TaxID=13093 RepID=UPI00254A11F0|nr:uncharacterized protein LOC130649272 isoform X2 [Hydractinia symbiolongicarpus]
MYSKPVDVFVGVCLFFLLQYCAVGYTLKELANEIEAATRILNRDVKNFHEIKRMNYNLGGDLPNLPSGIPKSFKCPRIPSPRNGVVKCGGSLCLVQCNPGFKHDIDHAFVYNCSGEIGEWSTIPKGKPIPWPNCKMSSTELSKSKRTDNGLSGLLAAPQGIPENSKCPRIPSPRNGVVRCGGSLCLVQCNPGFQHGTDTAFVYKCNKDIRKWSTLPKGKPIPWPDCTESGLN